MIDVLMGDDGDLRELNIIVGGQAVIAQRVCCRLHTLLGDWPLDTEAGIDWITFFGTKPTDVDAFSAVLVVEITDTPGVTGVQNLQASKVGDQAVFTMDILTDEGGGDDGFSLTVSAPGEDGNLSIVVGGVIGHSMTVVP